MERCECGNRAPCGNRQCVLWRTARSEVARLTAEVEAMRRCLADVCHVVLTDDAVTDTLWIDDTTTVADRIAQVLKIDTVAPFGGPSEALDAMRARKVGG